MADTRLIIHVNLIDSIEDITREDVERALSLVAEEEGVTEGEVSVTFLDERAMAVLNETHLGRAGTTDVIAFNLGERDAPLGDVYICPEVAEGSALDYGVELREELLRLVVHAALHLFGHEHPEGPERRDSEMFRLQEAILARLI
ncbi:MAG: rRNA maturation RNase YbeY [Gemmatimonadota bacterium]|nr:MAG: rRNA maturation RNase YbeY [Gemmatimonadota bacterium]